MFLTDKTIRRLVESGQLGITEFEPTQVRMRNGEKVLSYGLGPAGYDVRLKPLWKVFKREPYNPILEEIRTSEHLETYRSSALSICADVPTLIDPKRFDEAELLDVHEGNELVLWPGQYALAVTLERFSMPENVQGTFFAKSTYARSGLMLNTTNVQPGFDGEVVMEFYNGAGNPILIRADEGFAQIKFEYGDDHVDQTYQLGGTYQDQTGVQTPKV